MWTIEEFFGASNEDARSYILICDAIRESLLMLNYILMLVCRDVKLFYIRYYQFLSEAEAGEKEALFDGIICIGLTFSLAALISSILLNVSKLNGKMWPITVWMVVHGIVTISTLLTAVVIVLYLVLKFSLVSPPFYIFLCGVVLSTNFHFWTCWMTLVYYYFASSE